MRVGKLVVCTNDKFPAWVPKLYDQLPIQGTVYTVRAVFIGREQLAVTDKDGKIVVNGASDKSGGAVGILLEELKNGQDPLCADRELGFSSERFRELEEVEEEQELVASSGEEFKVPVTVP
jgi:hypothetical protein